jgi:TolB-like protein
MLHVSPTDPPSDEAEKKKKKDKIRSAWISFVGRIIAQIIGAAASIVFGVLILHKYQSGSGKAASTVAVVQAAEERPARRRARRSGEWALVVLPLQNFSGDAQQDAFADSMTEALTARFSQSTGMRVISRTSAMPYKSRQKTAVEIARELDVDWLLEGSVTRAGNRVRVTAQLIDAAADEHLWAHAYDRTVGDPLAVQDELAAAIARDVARARAGAQ